MPARQKTRKAAQDAATLMPPLSIFGVPVDRETIFADYKGAYKSSIEKRQRKLIIKTTFIKHFLHQNERIRWMTTAYSPTSPLEQALTGPAFLIFKRAILIFTDKRILHVPTRFNRSSHGSVSQINYDDCAGMQLKGRALTVAYGNNTEETFLYLGRPEKRKLKAFIDSLPDGSRKTGRAMGRTYLCPSCMNPLNNDARRCPSCQLEFKTDFQAKLRSLLIPGGGYFYSHYPLMGLFTGLTESALVSYMVFKWTCFHQGMPISFGVLALLAGVLILEKLIASFHARRLILNYLPATDTSYAMRKV